MRVLLAAAILASGLISPALAADKANPAAQLFVVFDNDRGRETRLKAANIVDGACKSIDSKTPRLSPETQRWMQGEIDARRVEQVANSPEFAKQFVARWATECQQYTQVVRNPSSERQEVLAWTLLAKVLTEGDAGIYMQRLQGSVAYSKDDLQFTDVVAKMFARDILQFVVADHLRQGL